MTYLSLGEQFQGSVQKSYNDSCKFTHIKVIHYLPCLKRYDPRLCNRLTLEHSKVILYENVLILSDSQKCEVAIVICTSWPAGN